jgi:hypothetical protein
MRKRKYWSESIDDEQDGKLDDDTKIVLCILFLMWFVATFFGSVNLG